MAGASWSWGAWVVVGRVGAGWAGSWWQGCQGEECLKADPLWAWVPSGWSCQDQCDRAIFSDKFVLKIKKSILSKGRCLDIPTRS